MIKHDRGWCMPAVMKPITGMPATLIRAGKRCGPNILRYQILYRSSKNAQIKRFPEPAQLIK